MATKTQPDVAGNIRSMLENHARIHDGKGRRYYQAAHKHGVEREAVDISEVDERTLHPALEKEVLSLRQMHRADLFQIKECYTNAQKVMIASGYSSNVHYAFGYGIDHSVIALPFMHAWNVIVAPDEDGNRIMHVDPTFSFPSKNVTEWDGLGWYEIMRITPEAFRSHIVEHDAPFYDQRLMQTYLKAVETPIDGITVRFI